MKLLRQKDISIAVAVFASCCSIFYSVVTYQLAEQREAEQISAVINAVFREKLDALGKLALDYSYWDMTIEESLIKKNRDWSEDNIGTYLIDTFGITNSYLLDPNGRTVFAFGEKDGVFETQVKVSDSFQQSLKQTISHERSSPEEATYIKQENDGLNLIAVSALTSEEASGERPKNEKAVLVLTKKITEMDLSSISKLYHLPKFHFAPDNDLKVVSLKVDNTATGISLYYKDHHSIWVELGGALLPLSLVLLAFVYFVRRTIADSNFQNELNEKLNEINQSLEATVEAKTRDLVLARDKAEESSHAKSLFLSNMSHEFRTPLNGILGFAQMLQMNKEGTLSEKQKGWVTQIVESGSLLLSLVNDVLDLARIESGRVKYEPEEFQPREVFKECYDIIKPMALERDISLKGLPETERLINVDREKFKHVILNLLGNAVKYGNDKGHIQFGCRGLGQDKLELYVEDDGIGIPRSDLEKIFEPFHRVPDISSSIEGTGVGLSIVKKNVELMNGLIKVSSTLGEGTCFTITLPAIKNSEKEEVQNFQI